MVHSCWLGVAGGTNALRELCAAGHTRRATATGGDGRGGPEARCVGGHIMRQIIARAAPGARDATATARARGPAGRGGRRRAFDLRLATCELRLATCDCLLLSVA
jgi:hypothetical protein